MTDYSAAASALGVPESILRRSVEARAKASGVGVDELLAAWAGGEAPPAPAVAPSPPPPAETAPPQTEDTPVTTSTAPVLPPPSPEPPARLGPIAPPVLVGVRQSPNGITAGVIAILFLSVMLAFVVPSLPQPGNDVRTSRHEFGRTALAGREAYLEAGCASCHTQLVRNVVADAGLGPVTLSDTNLVVGFRRIGPDLAAIGTRIQDTEALVALLSGSADHPAVALDSERLSELLAYLREST